MRYCLLYVVFFLILASGYAQMLETPTLSPISKISQEVGLTEVHVEYSRPSAKGRVIFGALVPFNKIWRTGANASSKLTLSEPARIGGYPIKAGTYAIYTIPGKDLWTIIIHSKTNLRSLAGGAYNKENDVLRFEIIPHYSNEYVETFTLQFTDIQLSGCHLQMSWENTVINIPIEVEVDEKVEAQMKELLKDAASIPHRTYFEAAQYYLHNSKNLDKALEWINRALDKSPENFRYGLLEAKIHDSIGNPDAAISTINRANLWARKANNANYIEQTELFRQYLMHKK